MIPSTRKKTDRGRESQNEEGFGARLNSDFTASPTASEKIRVNPRTYRAGSRISPPARAVCQDGQERNAGMMKHRSRMKIE